MRWLRRLRPDRAARRIPLAEPMEPRLLYSADLAAGLLLATSTGAAAAPEVRTLTTSGEYATAATTATTSAATAYAAAPLTFEANAGQAPAGVDFSAHGSGYGIALDDGQAALTLVTAQGQRTVTLQLQGANATPQGQGEGLLATKSNVVVGSDASRWATGLANYASILYRNVYDGVDLRYYGNQRQLEYDFIVAPGADAAQVALHFDGVTAASVADDGDLVLQVADSTGEVRFRAPVSYQRGADGSMQAVASRYELRADGSIGFALGDYDRSRELVIDPVLDYATYFGGTSADTVTAVATDSAGNVYITGHTNSTSGPFSSGGGGGGDIFVAKLSPDLSSVVWSTRIGGSADEQGNAIAVDANGNVAVAGWTKSNNFPDVPAILLGPGGGQQAVVFKLDASGALVFADGFDGNGATDSANAVGFDGSGNVYAAGQMSNTGLLSGVLGALLGSSDNAFVEKFSGSGTLVYEQQFGGGSTDAANGLAVGSGGDVYVVGTTQSSDMPMSGGAQTAMSGSSDGFLVHFDSSGNAAYSTYVGSSDNDTANAVAIDGSGKAFVAGTTRARSSVVFTTTTGAFMTSSPANNKVTGYLREYDTTLTGAASLLYSSYLGGSQADTPTGVAYARGRVIVTGNAGSGDFPVTPDAYAATNAGNALFLSVIDPAGGGSSDLKYGTFYGSSMTAGGVAVAGADVVLVGSTATSGLATTGSYQANPPGAGDGLVVRFTALANRAPVVSGPVALPAMAEDSGTVTITKAQFLANASDADRDALSVLNLAASTGALVDNGNGTWGYTPAANYNGTVAFTYDVSDGTASTAASAALSVTPVNDPPVALADSVMATRNTALTIPAATLLANDSDVENSPLTIASVTSGTGGTAVLNANGSVTFTPQANYSGPASFTYTVSDGGLTSAPATVSVTVNTLPAAANDTVAATEDTAATYTAATLLANDTDADAGDTLAIASVTSGAGGTAVLNANGSVTFTPNANFNGTASFTYRATDGKGVSAPATVTVNVAAVNDPPVAVADSFTTVEDNSINIKLADLLANDTDVEGSSLSVVSVAAVSGGTVVLNGNGTVKFTPDANFNGTATFTYVIFDGTDNSSPGTVTINVTPLNDPPVANDDTGVTNEDTPITFTAAQLLGNDFDQEGSPLTIVSVSGTGAVLNADGSVTFTPAANFHGTTSFNYRISDGTAISGNGKVVVTVNPVNDAPVAVDDALDAVSDTPITYTAAQLLGNDTDVDGDPLTIGSVTSGSGGTVVLNANGTVTFTPTAGFAGNATFTYTAKDASLSSNPATVTVRVNDVPVANADTLAATEDTAITYAASTLLGNDTDAVGNPLVIAGVGNATGGTVVLNANGTVTFTPFANFNGQGGFTYTASDGSLASAPAAVTVSVAPVNDAPTTSAVALPAISEDSGPVTITQSQLLANAADVDTGDTLSVVNLLASTGSLVDNGNGTWTFTAGANYNGTVSFTYGVSDGTATVAGTASLVVTPVNDAPTTSLVNLPGIAEDSGTTTITSAQLLANASDVDGNALSVTGLAASTGTLVDNGNGTWTFTPGANYNGTVSFTYGVSDGSATTAGTASLGVAPVNDAPTTPPVSLPGVAEDSGPVIITQSQLLANASDVDTGDVLSVVNLLASTGSLVDNGNGTWTFTPGANYNGTVSFTYGVSDGTATTAGSASLGVTPVNDAPTTSPVALPGIAEDSGPVTITQSQLLANAADVEGDALSVVNLLASTGSLVDNGNGTWTFTPGANYNGTVSFTYGVSDGSATTAGTASLGVAPVNDAPTTPPVSLPGVAEDSGPVIITQSQLLANASDVDTGDVLSVVNLLASTGALVDNGNGTWTFTPGANYNGTVSITYGVSDGTVTTAGSASLAVAAVNDAPTTAPITLPGMAEDGSPVTITQSQLLANAADVEGDPLTVVNLLANTGTLVDNGNGTWTFTPAANYNGTVSFTYGVSDGTATTTGTASLAVAPVNDAPTTTPVTLAPVAEDTPVTITQADLLANAADVDGDPLSVTGLAASTGTLVDNGNGTWTFTPAANASGPVSFTYAITDGTAATAGSASLAVTPVNDAPTTTPVTLADVAEDSGPMTITQSQLLANAGDVEGDALSVVNLAASTGTLVDNGNGTWTFTPGTNYHGTVGFTYGVSDGTATTAGSATLVVTPVNDAPTTAAVTLPGVPEDSGPATITQSQLLANAADVDGDALSVVNLSASTGSLVDNGNGTWTFTPGSNFNGTVTFSYGVSDGTATAAGSATLTVAPVNDAPSATPVTLPAMAEDGGAVTITSGQLLATAADVDGDPLSVTNLVAASGTLVDNGNGTWTFTPDSNYNGTVSFTYGISDGTATTAGGARLAVTPVNDAPTTGNVTLPGMQEDGGAVTITSAQLLANAADVDGDALAVTGLAASSGTLVDNGNGTWRFAPAANANGAVSFTYSVSDGTVAVAGSANLQVAPVNDAPATSPVVLPGMAEDGGSVTITPAQLLATATDVEGDALSVTNLAASSGTLVDNGNGTWRFTPERDFNGMVSFTYRVSDGSASTATTATLVVTPVNDAPQVTSGGQASVQQNSLDVMTVTATDVDTPAASLVYSIVGGADAALFRIDGTTGALTFARAPDSQSPQGAARDNVYDVVVQVSDGSAATQQAVAVRVVDVAAAAPPAPAPAPPPAPVDAPAPAPSLPAPVATAPAPAPAPATPTDTRGSRTGETLQEALGPSMATPIVAFNNSEVSFATAPARAVLDADGTHLFRTVLLDRGGIDFISTQPDAQLVLARFGIDSRTEGERLDDFQRTLRSAAFANQLDHLRESLRDELDLDKSVTISVVSVSLGLSLVYVLWLIRGGVLIGSYLSALPAWRILDPLPVLSRVDEEEEDDEPLEGARRDGRDTLRGFG